MRILVDVDGVIVDLASRLHVLSQRMMQRKLPPPEAWKEYDFDKAMGFTRSENEFFHAYLKKKDRLGYQLSFYPGAQNFLEALVSQGHEVVFCTLPWAGLDHWVEARRIMLAPYLGRQKFEIVYTSAKHLISGDWIIDDNLANLEKTPERGILFERPWNEKDKPAALLADIETAVDYEGVMAVINRPKEKYNFPVVLNEKRTMVEEKVYDLSSVVAKKKPKKKAKKGKK